MFSGSEYLERRAKLLDLIPDKYATVIVYGREIMKRIPTIPYKFSQNSDLLYLTGYDRPSGILALTKRADNYDSYLFLPPKDKEAERWEGFRTAFDVAKSMSGVQHVLSTDQFQDWVSKNLLKYKTCYTSSPDGRQVTKDDRSLRSYIDNLRINKDEKEKKCILKACEITHNAIINTLPIIKPGIREGLIDSTWRNECMKEGATGFGFEPITAVGTNALGVHYQGKDAVVSDGTFVVLDGGAEYNHYCADFARTKCVGKVPKEHTDLLLMINDIKNDIVQKAKAGDFLNLDHIHVENHKMIARVLRKFGIKTGLSEMRELCPDPTCHWIGLDVFDTPTIPTDKSLEAGNAFTISQAIYFDPANTNVPDVFKGIGVRFENTVMYE